jgi:uncharacterized protein with HEPN domain
LRAVGQAAGSGLGPGALGYVLGIVKAYTTRVGAGPFPTELSDAIGQGLGERGREFGTVTGRPRRCGWFDAVLVRQAVERNLEIVSEASRHLPDEVNARQAEVPWRAVAAIRNVLRHTYDEVIDERVWQIVTDELPGLKAAVLAMIADAERKTKG